MQMHMDIPENRVKPVKKMNDKSGDFKNTCFDRSEPVLWLRFDITITDDT